VEIKDPPAKGLTEHFPPLSAHEAVVEANRCLYCYDAPCTHACPTHIDIPRFIKKIATNNLAGSASAILEANLLGATCARVCPVQELCEGACVLGADHRPIMIGRLQRYAMDYAYGRSFDAVQCAPPTGRSVAVIGSGPAGLSCAGELARRGHSVTIYEKRELAGGLSTYGIIGIREPVETALAEVAMIERLGVRIETHKELGRDLHFADLQARFDAIFLAAGLGATPAMGIPGEDHILDGLRYIEQSKLHDGAMKIGRRVVVIGAGNTAIDCATVAKRLGAEQVTMVYRRTASEMTAYQHEVEFVRKEGIEFLFLAQPLRVLVENGSVTGLQCLPMELGEADGSGRRAPRPVGGAEFAIPADQVVKAVGQEKPALAVRLGLAVEKGYIRVNDDFETSLSGIFAGGDCIRAQNAASTVMAVEDGKLAASAIDRRIARRKEA
jgi:glutamate synthase (NADPH/NADH) small chain